MMVFHSTINMKVTLENMYFLPGLSLNLVFDQLCAGKAHTYFRLDRHSHVKLFDYIPQEGNWVLSSSNYGISRNVDTANTNCCHDRSV